MDNKHITIRKWLTQNGYLDIAELINITQSAWKANGKHTRRNWWDVLAGGKNGKPHTINGVQFPVLQAAQLRQKKSLTDNAIPLKNDVPIPKIIYTKRWKHDK